MKTLNWCKKQNGGLELISPNQNLCEEYFKKAEEALDAVQRLKGNSAWQISSAYYAMYFSLYAILMKLGVKSEIHKCTIEFMKRIKHFSKQDITLLEEASQSRVDVQYYTDRHISDSELLFLVNSASKFYFKCRDISSKLLEKDIIIIREDF